MKRTSLIVIGLIAITILLAGSFSAGIVAGKLFLPDTSTESISEIIPTIENTKEPAAESITTEQELPENHPTPKPTTESIAPSEDLEQLFEPFWETWDIVHDRFVDQPLDNQTLMQGAIDGMLEALGDQHTSFMDPDQFRQANIPLEGEYEGIGAWVDSNQEYLTIVSPMPNSPAERAGLEPEDQIIAVDGEDMTGIDGNLVIRRVLGEAGTEVTLTIRREGLREPFDVTIIRERITIPSVDYSMLEDDIVYVQLIRFADDTRDELRKALEDTLNNNPTGLILDLRNNGGGYLNSAIEVASEFIPEGVILYEDYGDGTRDEYEAIEGGLATDIPMVVLVNQGSASASEIVAGAIQDYNRAPLVGVTTFGKGSVQSWVPLSNDQGAVRVTIARWLTPSEHQISQIGLEPDYKIGVLTEADVEAGIDAESLGLEPEEVVILSEEDIDEEKDPQLEKAIEVLMQK
ncbi:MAG: S41 family peptidase [Anaerolineales bacterium]|jgi:carboxyl-terminal processing protease